MNVEILNTALAEAYGPPLKLHGGNVGEWVNGCKSAITWEHDGRVSVRLMTAEIHRLSVARLIEVVDTCNRTLANVLDSGGKCTLDVAVEAARHCLTAGLS